MLEKSVRVFSDTLQFKHSKTKQQRRSSLEIQSGQLAPSRREAIGVEDLPTGMMANAEEQSSDSSRARSLSSIQRTDKYLSSRPPPPPPMSSGNRCRTSLSMLCGWDMLL